MDATAAGEQAANEQALIRRFLDRGDGEDFRRLVEPHLPMVRRLLHSLLGGQREDMEDAEQEVLLELSRGLSGFAFRSSLATFIYSVARRRAVDLLRAAGRRRRLLERLQREAPSVAPGGQEERAAEREAARRRLLQAFRAVSPQHRQLVLLKDVEGFSIEEIAGLLALPVGTVKSRLHRVRLKLARQLRGRAWT